MTTDEALAFLAAHQPMPNDDEGTQGTIDLWISALHHAIALEPPDPRFVPLFLNSFPERMEIGAYQTTDLLIGRYPADEVVPHLIDALKSPNPTVEAFAAEFSMGFSDARMVGPLIETLRWSLSEDARVFAAYTLGKSKGEGVGEALREAQSVETDACVREAIEEAIAERLGI